MPDDQDKSGIAALDAELPVLRRLGTAGFIFAHDISLWGPDFYHSEFPRAWQVEYEANGYVHADPVVLWAMTNTGARRWSEIGDADPRGVMKAARRHGLSFGVCLVRSGDGRRSILSIARPDREFTDTEIAFLAATFEAILGDIERGGSALSEAEEATLRCLRDGLSYAEAADLLGVAVPTVKARLKGIREKLGARTATQAVARAIQRRLI